MSSKSDTCNYQHFWFFLACQDADTQKKTNECLRKILSAKQITQTSLDGVKREALKKFDFGCRDNSIPHQF